MELVIMIVGLLFIYIYRKHYTPPFPKAQGESPEKKIKLGLAFLKVFMYNSVVRVKDNIYRG